MIEQRARRVPLQLRPREYEALAASIPQDDNASAVLAGTGPVGRTDTPLDAA